MIAKGDLLEVNGERVTAASDVYTRLIFDSYDYSIARGGGEGGTAVSCINIVYPSGVMRTARFDNSTIRKIVG
jgi:hypothetical protein